MKKVLFCLSLAACAPVDPNTVYSCSLVAVCDGSYAYDTDDVCEGGQPEAQSAVDSWVSDCETTLIDEGCATYDCYADCSDTGTVCDETVKPSTFGPVNRDTGLPTKR